MKKFEFGDEVEVRGETKFWCKRIFLFEASGVPYCVASSSVTAFKKGEEVRAFPWKEIRAFEQPIYFYKWKKLLGTGKGVELTIYLESSYGEDNYGKHGWTRVESSKKTFEEIEG